MERTRLTNMKKLVILPISVLLLVVLSLGILALAGTSPSVDIEYINISYGIETEIKYAVKADNIPDGATVGVTVREGSPTSGNIIEAENQGVTTINGESYIVFGLPIHADDMTENYYATPYIKDGATSYGECKKSSIIEYSVKRRAMLGEGDTAKRELLDALLEYGAMAQIYNKASLDRLANADFYKVELVNAAFDDGFSYGYFAVGESISATAPSKTGYTLESWTDSEGNAVSTELALSVTAPARDEIYTANMAYTGDNIAYILDGGTLPEGKWTKYPADADYTLPVPTKAGYKFCGWYTEDGIGIGTIPAGSTEQFTLTAKWSKIVYDKSGSSLYSGISRLSIDNYDDNSLVVDGDNLIWGQGTTAISQITVNGSIPGLLSNEKIFTIEIDLALEKDTPCFGSTFRFRQSSNMVTVFKTNTEGDVLLGASGPKIAKLTEQMQKISIVADFEKAIFIAYSEGGDELASTPMTLPAGFTGESYYDILTAIVLQSVSNKPTEATALVIGGIAINAGNSAAGVNGLPVTIADSENKTDYTIVYNSGSLDAQSAAIDLADAMNALGFGNPEIKPDYEAASVSEIVIGDADRADVAEIKAYLEEAKKSAPDNYWWAYMYKSGKLYIIADSNYGYMKAIKVLTTDYVSDDGLVVYSELKSAASIDAADAILESLLDPNPHDAYMSYTTYDNFYDGYTDPYGMKDSDYKTMKITRTSAKIYTIEYADELGGKWQTTFVQKRWGCWMMGALGYVDSTGKSTAIQPGSTDYEFVLSCAGSDQLTFRGGNHGDYPKVYGDGWVWSEEDSSTSNDRLLDLTFYDGKSGDKFELAVGESTTCNGIRIVMHNNIYEYDYKQENVLINVEKSYLYNGYDILCDSKLYMTQDVRFGGSTYPCMLPISKNYGDSMFIYNMDGTVDYVKTLPYGQTTEKIHGGHLATKVELWGPADPALHMTVEILNPDHQFISSSSAGYLKIKDMSTGSNKIYFSSFTNNKTVKKGTELNYQSKWSFSYQADFVAPDREPDLIIQ